MNRLQAAKRIAGRLDVIQSEGGAVHFDYSYLTRGPKRGIYRAESHWGAFNNVMSDWKVVGWKEVLKFIRENYPRRDREGQCTHKYEVWNDRGTFIDMHVNCTLAQEHFHCKCCGGAETGTGVYSTLCHDCTKKSDDKRQELTRQILDYESTFNVRFKEVQEWRDQYEGVYDYETHRGHRGEDFHSDG